MSMHARSQSHGFLLAGNKTANPGIFYCIQVMQMKKNYNRFLPLFVLLFVAASCRKDISEREMPAEIRIDKTIMAGADLWLPLAPYGDEGELATLLTQGSHFAISQLENESDQFSYLYHYRSTPDYKGEENIMIAISQEPGNRKPCRNDSTFVYLHLTVQ